MKAWLLEIFTIAAGIATYNIGKWVYFTYMAP